MNKHVDIHYILEDAALASAVDEEFFFYQETTKIKEYWGCASTKALPKKISLHNLLTFTARPVLDNGDDLPEADLAVIPRRGPGFFDFDNKEDPAEAVAEAQQAHRAFVDEYGVDPRGLTFYVSGSKGAGLIADSRCFGERYREGHANIADFLKTIAASLHARFPTLDLGIYNKKKGRLNRRLNAKRENGNFRALIHSADLDLSPYDLLDKTRTAGPRLEYPAEVNVSAKLEALYVEFLSGASSRVKITAPSSPRANGETRAPTPSPESPLRCIQELNSCEPERISQEKNYHDLTYLGARQLHHVNEGDAALGLAPFIRNWRSGSYGREEERLDHFLVQHRAVSTEGSGRACEAMRKSLPKLNCAGCYHFSDVIEAMGTSLAFRDGILNMESYNAKGKLIETFLANFHPSLEVVQSVVSSDNTKRPSQLTFKISIADGRTFSFEIASEDLQRKDVVLSKISGASDGQAQISAVFWNYVIAFATARPAKKAITKYTTTGFHGRNVFITDTVKIEKGLISQALHPLLAVEDVAFAKRISFSVITEEDLKWLLMEWLPKILRMGGRGQVSLIHGLYAGTIVDGFLDVLHRFFMTITGGSGIGKSALVRATYSLFCNSYKENALVTAAATAMSIEAQGYRMKDLPFPIDDVKQANISNMNQFRRVCQNACDASGRGRLSADAVLQNTMHVRGRLFLNGEDSILGNEPSLAGRSLELPAEKVEDFSRVVEFLQQHQEAVRGIIPHFIAHLQRQSDVPALKARYGAIRSSVEAKLIKGENRERVVQSISSVYFGLSFFYGWIRDLAPELSDLISAELQTARELLLVLGNGQIKTASEMVPANAYLTAVRETLSSGRAMLSPLNCDGDPYGTSENKTIIGFQDPDDEVIFLLPGVSLAAAKDIYLRAGTTLDFSLKAIGQSLRAGDHIEKANQEKNTYKLRLKETTVDTWALRRSSVFPEAMRLPRYVPKDDENNIVDMFDSNKSTKG